MPVSYGGIYLPVVTPEAAAWVESNISTKEIYPWQRAAWPGPNCTGWAFPGYVTDPPIEVGSLYWPTGASRWAIANFFITDDQWGAIKTAAYQGGVYRQLPLVIDSQQNSGTVISPGMWLLPSRFEVKIPGSNGLYLMTLVDDRYFWQVRSTGPLDIIEGTTTWQDLYNSASAAIRVLISPDDIPAAYLQPGVCMRAFWEQMGLFLDAVAYNVGQRIVRNLDGSVRAMNVTNSKNLVTFNLSINPSPTGVPVRAGGAMLLPAPFPNDSPGVLPESVTLTTHAVVDGDNLDFLFPVVVKLKDLALPDFSGAVVEIGNSKVFHDAIESTFSAGPDPSNLSILQALAKQVATDWYRYQVSPLDIKFAGIAPWIPEGWSDSIEWLWRKDEVTTRVQRGTWNDLVEELCHAPTPSLPPTPPLPIPPPPVGNIININTNIFDIQIYANLLIEGIFYLNIYNCCIVYLCNGIVYCDCNNPCSPPPHCVPCCGCPPPGTCSRFNVVLTGITGGDCCLSANGSWPVDIALSTPGLCYWRGEIPPGPGCMGPSILEMNCASDGTVQVAITGSLGSYAIYQGTLNCCAPTTLNLLLSGSPPGVVACNWFATLSIVPDVRCNNCCGGSGSVPGSGSGIGPGNCGALCCPKCKLICSLFDVTIASVVDGPGPPAPTDMCCPDLNGIWPVTRSGTTCQWIGKAGIVAGAANCSLGWTLNLQINGCTASLTIGKNGEPSQSAIYVGKIDNCNGPNILRFQSSAGGAPPCIWPRTVSVAPNASCGGDCGPGGGTGSGVAGCCGCTVMPETWTIDTFGWDLNNSPANCLQCTSLQGPATGGTVWHMSNIRSGIMCVWWSEDTATGVCASGPGPAFQLFCNDSSVILQMRDAEGGGPGTTWSISRAAFNCIGPNVLTKGISGGCDGNFPIPGQLPHTVTINPG